MNELIPPSSLGRYFSECYTADTNIPTSYNNVTLSESNIVKLEKYIIPYHTPSLDVEARVVGTYIHSYLISVISGKQINNEMVEQSYGEAIQNVSLAFREWLGVNKLEVDLDLTGSKIASKGVEGRPDLVLTTESGEKIVAELKSSHSDVSYADHVKFNTTLKVCTLIQASEYVRLLQENGYKVSRNMVLLSLQFHGGKCEFEIVPVDLTEATQMGEYTLPPYTVANWLREVSVGKKRTYHGREYVNKLRSDRKRVCLEQGTYICPECRHSFSLKETLEKHVKAVHEKTKDYVCGVCGVGFALPGTLHEHIKCVHEKIRKHKCTHCSATFSKRRDLKIHDKTVHQKVRDVQCVHCARMFSLRCNMVAHVKLKHI